MKNYLTIALVGAALIASSSAFAAGKCSTAPKAKWQTQTTLQSKLEGEGFKISKIKVEGGCYEVYATDKAGKRANMAYNAETLDKLENAEAGEN